MSGSDNYKKFISFKANIFQNNTLWVLMESLSISVFNLLSIIMIMRIMGPEPYGKFAFSLSILNIILIAGTLGLDTLLIKRFIENKDKVNELLGTAILMKYMIIVPIIFFINIYAWSISNFSQTEIKLLVCISIIALIMPLTTTIISKLNSLHKFKNIARRRTLAVFIGNIVKLILIILEFNIVVIAFTHVLVYIMEFILLYKFLLYNNSPSIIKWRLNMNLAKKLFAGGSFLYVASIFSVLYMNSDLFIIRSIMGVKSVGEYAIIPQILLSAQMIPYAITLTALPSLFSNVNVNPLQFKRDVKKLIKILLVASFVTMIPLMFILPMIIPVVFGEAYIKTAMLLKISCLSIPPIFLRFLTTKLFICYEKGISYAMVELFGLCVSVISSLILIKDYGLVGIAISINITYFSMILVSMILLSDNMKVYKTGH